MEDLATTPFAKTVTVITNRALNESKRAYGGHIDELILEHWVQVTLAGLLMEQTRVTTFVPLLAMRDIREQAERYSAGLR